VERRGKLHDDGQTLPSLVVAVKHDHLRVGPMIATTFGGFQLRPRAFGSRSFGPLTFSRKLALNEVMVAVRGEPLNAALDVLFLGPPGIFDSESHVSALS
jgi:hypothetical protein